MSGTAAAPDASEQLAAAAPRLHALFAPYNDWLVKLLGEGFAWREEDHAVPALSKAERERAINRTRARIAQHARREHQTAVT